MKLMNLKYSILKLQRTKILKVTHAIHLNVKCYQYTYKVLDTMSDLIKISKT